LRTRGWTAKRWTADEDRYLIEHPTIPANQAACALGRTRTAIQQRRVLLRRQGRLGPLGRQALTVLHTVRLHNDLSHAIQAYQRETVPERPLTEVIQEALRRYCDERSHPYPSNQAVRSARLRPTRPELYVSLSQEQSASLINLLAATDEHRTMSDLIRAMLGELLAVHGLHPEGRIRPHLPWTAEDDAFIAAHPEMSLRMLAAQMGRSYDSVAKRRSRLQVR
jgi:hypothetical protein